MLQPVCGIGVHCSVGLFACTGIEEVESVLSSAWLVYNILEYCVGQMW